MDTVIARMYEAAADERLWFSVLREMQLRLAGEASWFFAFQRDSCVAAWATGGLQDVIDAGFGACDDWAGNPQLMHILSTPADRFVLHQRYFPRTVLVDDEIAQLLQGGGLQNQVGAPLQLPDGVGWMGISRSPDAPFAADEIERISHLHGHLVHATQLSAQLAHGRAQDASNLLQGLGQAAAVLSRTGSLMACNALFERTLTDWIELDWRMRPRLRDPMAQQALANALALLGVGQPVPIPVRASSGEALSLRLSPLMGAGSDCFMGGWALLTVHNDSRVPPSPAQALQRDHGLSDKESRLACLLACGFSLRGAADELQLTYASARTYLDRIYGKTDTHRQADLVRLVLQTRESGA